MVSVPRGQLQSVLGTNLRAYRTSRGMSQEALARELQVHRTYMGGLERGERNPTLQSVERIAHRLGVHPLALLTQACHQTETANRENGDA